MLTQSPILFHTFIETIPLAEVECNRAQMIDAFFADCEEATQLRLPTLAGFVCVKRALVAALNSTHGAHVLVEKEFVLGHNGNGGPVILSIPDSVHQQFVNVCISVSHTRTHAYGCATVAGGGADAG